MLDVTMRNKGKDWVPLSVEVSIKGILYNWTSIEIKGIFSKKIIPISLYNENA